MTGRESEIGEKYHDSCEKLGKSTMRIPANSKRQTEKESEENEIGKNYPDSCQKSKTSNIEMLNSIDFSVKTLNEVNVSLISAPCPATVKATIGESVEVQ